ncbi:MAG: polysaccharide biosynthesis/export family protein [bacterium]
MTTKRGLSAICFPVAALFLAGCVSGPTPAAEVRPYRPQHPAVAGPVRSVLRDATAVPRQESVPVVTVASATNVVAELTFDKTGRVLRKGDRVQVTIYAPPEPFSSPNVVDEDGRINFPLIGPIVVAGKSCGEAQRFVEKAYIDQKIYKTITVIIVPPESEYAVTGEVIRPGPYPLTRDLTLLQALARSGRYTEFADKTKVYLTRNNDRVEIKLEDIRQGKRRDIVIIPGDVIEVPRSPW